MNEQSCAPQEDPVPPQWKTRWYHTRERFLRFLSRILRMPPTLEVEKALRDQHFRVFEEVKKRYLGHCPFHPEEMLFFQGQGRALCYFCKDEAYLKSLDDGPQTDPQKTLPLAEIMQLAQRHPSLALRKLQHPVGGPKTQAHRAVSWLIKKER